MKLSITIGNPTAIRDLIDVISVLSKVSKSCICNSRPDKLYFIGSTEVADNVPLTWVDMDLSFFSTYRMKGVNAENNEIYFKFLPIKLSRIFALAKDNIFNVQMALSREIHPYLSVVLHYRKTPFSVERQIRHDIPIIIIRLSEWSDYTVPNLLTKDITVKVTSDFQKLMGLVFDMLKSVSSIIVVGHSDEKGFYVSADGDMATIKISSKESSHIDVSTQNANIFCPILLKNIKMTMTNNLLPNLSISIAHRQHLHLVWQVASAISYNCAVSADFDD